MALPMPRMSNEGRDMRELLMNGPPNIAGTVRQPPDAGETNG
jgi:hypothetical protein